VRVITKVRLGHRGEIYFTHYSSELNCRDTDTRRLLVK